MPYDRRRIRELTTASEFELVAASAPGALRQLSEKALKSNISRTRRLRDKQRDLVRRRRLARRARTGSKHGGGLRHAEKARLFDETLKRFSQRLQTLNRGPRLKKVAAAKTRTKGQAALRQKARTPRMKAIQGHVGSRGRRVQARRDSR